MNVTEVHPDYVDANLDWQIVSDSLSERKIKKETTKYLPKTQGQALFYKKMSDDTPYLLYQARAMFPEIVSPAVTALTGIAHRLPYEFEASERFQEQVETITPNLESLDELSRRCVRKVLMHGRFGLLSDVDADGNAQVSTYEASSIKDWREEKRGGRRVLTYVKLEEEKDHSEDITLRDYRKQYRILQLDEEGFYVAKVVDDAGVEVEDIQAQKASGERLTEIPFTVIGSVDLTWEIDESPMLPLAKAAIRIYQLDADYMQSLHMTAEPTPVISGITDADDVNTIGSAVLWKLTNPESKAYYLEVSGNGITSQEKAIENAYEKAAKIAGELSKDSARQESGEAIRLRMFNRHATLFSVAQSVGNGLQKALSWCSDMVGTGDVQFTPNLDFTGSDISEALIDVINKAVMAGNLPKSVLYNVVRDAGYTELENDDLDQEVEDDTVTEPGGVSEPE